MNEFLRSFPGSWFLENTWPQEPSGSPPYSDPVVLNRNPVCTLEDTWQCLETSLVVRTGDEVLPATGR